MDQLLPALDASRLSAKTRRIYDTPRTPYERVLSSSEVERSLKASLRRQYRGLDPVALLERLRRLQDQLWAYGYRELPSRAGEPSCAVPAAPIEEDAVSEAPPNDEAPREGLLALAGYNVRKSNGLTARERRAILRRVYHDRLPSVHNASYRQEWGKPRSAMRLQKMANSLASFARDAKRKNNYSQQAVRKWEEDLEWLRTKYYSGRHQFSWPNTTAPGSGG